MKKIENSFVVSGFVGKDAVLILVLVEHTLRAGNEKCPYLKLYVLILVLVEHTLRGRARRGGRRKPVWS